MAQDRAALPDRARDRRGAQIAIVLASAAVVTGAMALAWIGAGLGVVGLAFCVIGFFAPTSVHIF